MAEMLVEAGVRLLKRSRGYVFVPYIVYVCMVWYGMVWYGMVWYGMEWT